MFGEAAIVDLAEELLRTDFEQCSRLLEHYDDRFARGITLVFGVFAGAMLSVIVLLYAAEDLFLKISTICGIYLTAWMGGTVLLTSLARNRKYFCRIASYVSEIRQYYLAQPSVEIENRSGMFTDVGFPDPLTPTNSRTVIMFGIAIINSLFLGLGTYYALHFVSTAISPAWIALFVAILSTVVQSVTLRQSLS